MLPFCLHYQFLLYLVIGSLFFLCLIQNLGFLLTHLALFLRCNHFKLYCFNCNPLFQDYASLAATHQHELNIAILVWMEEHFLYWCHSHETPLDRISVILIHWLIKYPSKWINSPQWLEVISLCRPRTALFHLQFCKNLSLSYDRTLQKQIYHSTKLWRVWNSMRLKACG